MRNLRPVIGLFWLLLSVSSHLNAQAAKKTKYFFEIKMLTGERRMGILDTIDGADLIIREKGSDSLMTISSSNIRLVKIRKLNAGRHILKGTGIVIGATAGAVAGFILGSTSGPDCEDGTCIDLGPELRGIGQGLAGAVVGGVTGGFLASRGKKYIIDGMAKNFENMRMLVSE